MKVTNYRLQGEMEHLQKGKEAWFKDYVRQVLESDKPYYAKADYIGLSINEIDNKIAYLSSDIKEMQLLKKKLTEAKEIALRATAEVLLEYGIDKLDGTAISSITITQPRTKIREILEITDKDALIELGYCKVVLDEKSVKEAMLTIEGMNEIEAYIKLDIDKEEIPAKIRVNAKRSKKQHETMELLEYPEDKAA